MTLTTDIARCDGELITRMPCLQRDTCQRYTERKATGAYAYWVSPMIPGPCSHYKPAPGGVPGEKQEGEA